MAMLIFVAVVSSSGDVTVRGWLLSATQWLSMHLTYSYGDQVSQWSGREPWPCLEGY